MSGVFASGTAFTRRNGTGGGGGSGTVTAVAGGVGITATPEPIVGAGVVDLDLFSLTTEPIPAAGDWFGFVDVSVGTTPAAQRKTTLVDMLGSLEAIGIDADTLDGLDATAFVPVTRAINTTAPLTGGGTLAGDLTLGITGSALTRVNDTNVTLTLGGSPTTALLAATSLTLGWSGQLGLVRGGTAADLSATGGTSQVLKQSTLGAAVTVGQLAFTDISGSVTDAQVPDTITIANLTQVTTRSHASLQNLTADDHTQYTLRAGRTGTSNDTTLSTTAGGTFSGSSAANQSLTLKANSNAGSTTGTLSLFGSVIEFRGMNIPVGSGPELRIFETAGATKYTGLQTSSSGVTQSYIFPLTAPAGYLQHDGAGNLAWATTAAPGGAAGGDLTGTYPNPTVADADLIAIRDLVATAGMLSRTGAGAFAARTLTAPAAGLTISNPTGSGGNPTWALANDLAALEGLGSTGIAVRTAADTWAQRSLAVTDSASVDFTLTNADGVAGNPTITAAVLPAGVDHNTLANLTTGDPHTQYTLLAGRTGTSNDTTLSTTAGGTLSGSSAASQNLTLQSTSHATKGAVVMPDGAIVTGTVGVTNTFTIGQGSTGTDNTTLTLQSGNSGATRTSLWLARSNVVVAGLTYNGSHTIFEYTTDIQFRTSPFTTVRATLDATGQLRLGDTTTPSALLDLVGKFTADTNGLVTKYGNIATQGLGVPAIYASTITGTQTGAVTVLSYTPPATAGRYRISVVITTTSATNSGTIGVTLDYRDSQGANHSGDAIPIHALLATSIAATVTVAASKEYHIIPWSITINNAAIAIVVKTVTSGTVSYTAAATIEQLA